MRYEGPRVVHNANVITFRRWLVYCFVSKRGQNVIREWLDELKVGAAQRAEFQLKLTLLENGGPDTVPGFITETPVAKNIYKAKIKGNKGWIQLRPMLCKGPLLLDQEFTFLLGVVEKDRVLIPKDWERRAQTNREIVVGDPKRRRREGVL
jgi:hypothetical protein